MKPKSKVIKKPTSVKKYQPTDSGLTKIPIFEPKITNRWICHIRDNKNNLLVPIYFVKGFTRPTLQPSNGINLTTPITFGNMSLTMYDGIEISTSRKMVKLINDKNTFTVTLTFLNPTGDVIEEWVYHGCKLEEISFSELNWGSDGAPSTVSAVISVQNAILK